MRKSGRGPGFLKPHRFYKKKVPSKTENKGVELKGGRESGLNETIVWAGGKNKER